MIDDGAFSIPEYTLYRDDSDITIGHRGVCVYVKNSVFEAFKLDVSHYDWAGINNLFLTVSCRNFSVLLGCIYRPRSCLADQQLVQFLYDSLSRSENVIITGDFNCPDIDWPLRHLPSFNSPSFPYAELVSKSAFQQLIEQPTRYRSGQTPSLLDLFLVSDSNLVSDIHYLPPFGKSDHLTLSTELQFRLPSVDRDCSKVVQSINYRKVSEMMLAENWSSICPSDNNVECVLEYCEQNCFGLHYDASY